MVRSMSQFLGYSGEWGDFQFSCHIPRTTVDISKFSTLFSFPSHISRPIVCISHGYFHNFILLFYFSPVPIPSRLFSTFSSINFSVSFFMWRSLIHLDMSFVQGDKNGSILILLHCKCQLCQHHLLKILPFFTGLVLVPLSKIK